MPGSKEDFLRNNAFSLYYFYGHTLAQEPLPRGHEVYNLGKPFLSHLYFILSLSDLCLGVKKTIFKGIMHIHCMTYMAKLILQEPLPRWS